MAQDETERRKRARFKARFGTLCSDGRQAGAGVLVDLSRAGARVAETSLSPGIGAKVRLYVFVQPVSPFEIVGEVVRQGEADFAIEFTLESPEVRRLVDEAAGVLGLD